MDLHELCSEYGLEIVAGTIGITPRALIDIRRGFTAMTIDDFYELSTKYPAFDAASTVERIGNLRETRKTSRKFRVTGTRGRKANG